MYFHFHLLYTREIYALFLFDTNIRVTASILIVAAHPVHDFVLQSIGSISFRFTLS